MNLLRKEITLKNKRFFVTTSRFAKFRRTALLGLCAFVTVSACAPPPSKDEARPVEQSNGLVITIAESSVEWQLTASNSTALSRENELIRIPASSLPEGLNVDDHLVILLASEDTNTPSQSLVYQWAQSPTFSGQKDLVIQASFEPQEHKTLRLVKLRNGHLQSQESMSAYAELAVRMGGSLNDKQQLEGGQYAHMSDFQLPSDHTIGNKLFKYEGFGWESELVGYRYYFDNRGAVDIFGKQRLGLALKDVGLDGDDYHALDDWGMDILKVGGSLGLGALGAYVEGEVIKVTDFQTSQVSIRNEAIFASAILSAEEWQVANKVYDLQVSYRIAGGQRLTEVIGKAAGLDSWASGIVNHVSSENGVELLEEGTWENKDDNKSSAWCYRATYGAQSLNNDNLGMALFYPCANSTLIDSELNVAVAMQHSIAHYYFLAGWEAENTMFATREGFVQYLKQTQLRLNNAIQVTWQ